MAEEETPFVGVLYIGLMMTGAPASAGVQCSLGDPETQAILLRLESDLIEALEACIEGRLSDTEFHWKPGASASVIASSGGYPGSYRTALKLPDWTSREDSGVQVFHSGTTLMDGAIKTSGGRVLAVSAAAGSLTEALNHAYQAIERIHFDGCISAATLGTGAEQSRCEVTACASLRAKARLVSLALAARLKSCSVTRRVKGMFSASCRALLQGGRKDVFRRL